MIFRRISLSPAKHPANFLPAFTTLQQDIHQISNPVSENKKGFSCLLSESLLLLHLHSTFQVCVQQIEKHINLN